MDTQLGQITSRDEMIRYFNGYSTERVEELAEQSLRRPLVKTHLLELLDGRQDSADEALRTIFGERQMALKQLDDSLFFVSGRDAKDIGFVETLSPRMLALYSTIKADELNSWVKNLVRSSRELDHVWLSGRTFEVLWDLVVKLSKPRRYSQMVFTHDSIFEIDSGGSSDEGDDELQLEPDEIYERRATRFRMVDQVRVINDKLKKLQEIYAPLHAISQLRFPSPIGRGGHDFYDDGRVTNRGQDFRDHRSHVLFVVRIYEKMLRSTEDETWYGPKGSTAAPVHAAPMTGVPVTIRFHEPLSQEVFDHWITSTFGRVNNRFRLWGNPIRLGPTKVHVYGADRHLWQPIFLELTEQGCVAIIPTGTCGNTVHRLVTNIQRYLDPAAEAFIGNAKYEELVRSSSQGIDF